MPWRGGEAEKGGPAVPAISRQLLTSRVTDETHVPGMRGETGMDLGRVVASVCELVWLWPTDIHRHLRWPIFEIAAMQIHFFSVLTRLQYT